MIPTNQINTEEHRRCYLYRHIRLDTNEPFYIGIGTKKTKPHFAYSQEYKRALETKRRNKYWTSIYNSIKIDIEILLDNLTTEEAKEKEKEFIALYGRKDLGKGTLSNMTDGGDGMWGYVPSEEQKKLKSELWLTYEKNINKIYKPASSKKVLNKVTGQIFNTIREAADSIGMVSKNLSYRLNGKVKNDTDFIFLDDSLNIEKEEIYRAFNIINGKKYKYVKDAAKDIGMPYSNLKYVLKGNLVNTTPIRLNENFILKNSRDIDFIPKSADDNKTITNIQTLEVFHNKKEVAMKNGYNYYTFFDQIRGRHFNDTPFQKTKDFKEGLEINHKYNNRLNKN